MNTRNQVPAPWMSTVLWLAALYHFLWGSLVLFFPALPFEWADRPPPEYLDIWRSVGLLVGVYGMGYAIAAYQPFRYWPILFVGFMAKLLIAIHYLFSSYRMDMPAFLSWTIILNAAIWLLPLGLILYGASQAASAAADDAASNALPNEEFLNEFQTQGGMSLAVLSFTRPALLVFLRHLGCTFCRETLSDLSARRYTIESTGTQLVLVHMGTEEQAAELFANYRLDDVPRISDPECRLYRAFGLGKGSFCQLFGAKVWWRAMGAGLLSGHGIGRLIGDGFQMPGVFLISQGHVVGGFRHETIADRPDYESIARSVPQPEEIHF